MANEKQLIYKEDLLETILGHFGIDLAYLGSDLQFCQEAIENAPTVDAVEVVRCEKCLYRSQYCDENGLYKCGGLQTEDGDLVLMVKPDFFCAFGERRGAKMDGDGDG